MMTNKLPKSCNDAIHGLEIRFVQGDVDNKRKMHAVTCETMMMPKYLGGVGLRHLNVLNKVCLMKLG